MTLVLVARLRSLTPALSLGQALHVVRPQPAEGEGERAARLHGRRRAAARGRRTAAPGRMVAARGLRAAARGLRAAARGLRAAARGLRAAARGLSAAARGLRAAARGLRAAARGLRAAARPLSLLRGPADVVGAVIHLQTTHRPISGLDGEPDSQNGRTTHSSESLFSLSISCAVRKARLSVAAVGRSVQRLLGKQSPGSRTARETSPRT